MKKFFSAALILLIFMILPAVAGAMDVTLEWDAPADGVVEGYAVCQSKVSGVYDRRVDCTDVGNVLLWTATVPDVFPLFWVVYAYNIDAESLFSNEVSVPGPPPDPIPAPGSPVDLGAKGTSGVTVTRSDGVVFWYDFVTKQWYRQP